MLFNSATFVVFFCLFIALWPWLRARKNTRWAYLVVASMVFYGWWDWRLLFLIIWVGSVDFVAALGMQRFPQRRTLCLVLSLIATLGTLASFKYLDFGINNVNWLLALFGGQTEIPLAYLPLPVGISFYTFQAMSYTIDVYRGQLKPTRNIVHFFAYLSMFPQLVAGPIVRAAHLLPQLEQVHPTTAKARWAGLHLILFGYAKKVVIADNLNPVVQAAIEADVPADSGALWWLVMLMFAFQIYCDFSGYSDIARGLAKWMGYDFPLNFDHPYISSSFREFWTRWHISLSSWFRDYVYIPLGGSRNGPLAAHRNMWITMLLSGVWHGASWTMVMWAAAHAFFLSAERVINWPKRLGTLPGGRHLATLIVFLLTVIAWVPFLATSARHTFQILAAMFDFSRFNLGIALEQVGDAHLHLILIMVARQLYFHFRLDRTWRSFPRPRRMLEPVVLAGLIWACLFLRGPTAEFIYFQF
ncbi:MAG: MBOAT family protein [Phycisphaerae bacterium]|nr:MBOAT family protein [Phycisphaerae bacterium]